MSRINPNNKKHDEIPSSLMSDEFDHEPTFMVGNCRYIGEANRYDEIASNRGIRWVEIALYPIYSGKKKIIVKEIVKSWRPKKGSGINSWYSNYDYSDDSRYEPYWEVYCQEENLFYELADFLEYIP